MQQMAPEEINSQCKTHSVLM